MKNFVALISVLIFSTLAYAGFSAHSGTTNLGVFTDVTCSTGLTCTKVGSSLTMVSGPAISTSTISTSSTIHSGGNFDVGTTFFTVAAASGNMVSLGNFNLSSDFNINTNKFQVVGASGNTSTAGTLSATGNLAINTNKFTVTASSGNTLVAGTLAVTGATTLTGAETLSGGVALTAPGTNFHGWLPPAVASSTSATPSATVVYVSQIFIPFNTTITGLYNTNAATCGTNKWIGALFNASGGVVANSSTSGITCSGSSGYQALAFTAPVAVTGPAMYWVGLYVNGTTDRYYAVPALGQGWGLAGSVSTQTFGTVATITPPTTFTADVGPVMFTY